MLAKVPLLLAASHALPKHYFKGFFEKGFEGDSIELTYDGSKWISKGNEEWQGQLQSFILGEETYVKMCYDAECKSTRNMDASELYGPHLNSDMRITAHKIHGLQLKPFAPKEPHVILFASPNCMAGHAGIFGPGNYLTHDLEKNHILDKHMTAVKTADRVKVTFYMDNYYEGQPYVLEGPAEYCQGIPGFPDHVLSSMTVEERPPMEHKGYWQIAVQSNQEINTELSNTVTTTTGRSLSKTDEVAITTTISAILSFLTFGISFTYASITTHEVSHTFAQSTTRSCSASCSNEKSEQVALYQWMVDSLNVQSEGDITTTSTCFYQCRYGNYTTSEPKCPAGACLDSNCETCHPWKKNEEYNLFEGAQKFLE